MSHQLGYVGNHAKGTAKGVVNNIHFSPLVNTTTHLIREENEVGQA